ncbi:MAG: efflux RND transporter periplasmic adaptor subunit [Rhodothermales bacterium]|nr:efflux RND transporter periplasmic adaptor subunit [Rhodothermales bacterium]MBO6780567.1 efflux RND transporter periplasmic adaptor subunit [Rhodothermales bacterium]
MNEPIRRPAPQALLSLFLVTLLAGSTLIISGCNGDAEGAPTEEEEEVPALPVETTAASVGDISAFFSGTATLTADDETDVVAKSGGIVTAIYVEEGGYVRKGQALAQLDDERLAIEVARAEAELKRLEGELERNKLLFERQLISAEEIERSQYAFDTQKAAFDLAKLALEHTTVRAPIAGVVSSRMVKVGNMVQTFSPTFRITSFNPLLAEMHVPERELNKLQVGQDATVRVDALPEQVFQGRILRIAPVVDASTGTFKVTVEIRDRSGSLKPGMFGRIGIVYDTHAETVLVPKQAVLTQDDESAVFVVQNDTAFRQLVVRGFENDRFVEVLSGVTAGTEIITTGQTNLRDSSRVEVIR